MALGTASTTLNRLLIRVRISSYQSTAIKNMEWFRFMTSVSTATHVKVCSLSIPVRLINVLYWSARCVVSSYRPWSARCVVSSYRPCDDLYVGTTLLPNQKHFRPLAYPILGVCCHAMILRSQQQNGQRQTHSYCGTLIQELDPKDSESVTFMTLKRSHEGKNDNYSIAHKSHKRLSLAYGCLLTKIFRCPDLSKGTFTFDLK